MNSPGTAYHYLAHDNVEYFHSASLSAIEYIACHDYVTLMGVLVIRRTTCEWLQPNQTIVSSKLASTTHSISCILHFNYIYIAVSGVENR